MTAPLCQSILRPLDTAAAAAYSGESDFAKPVIPSRALARIEGLRESESVHPE